MNSRSPLQIHIPVAHNQGNQMKPQIPNPNGRERRERMGEGARGGERGVVGERSLRRCRSGGSRGREAWRCDGARAEVVVMVGDKCRPSAHRSSKTMATATTTGRRILLPRNGRGLGSCDRGSAFRNHCVGFGDLSLRFWDNSCC
ncbi:hypothetical protein KC19_3G101400 [Ceratodon purpureus]|uniref:Uncharacterized protein n=1 Tax=Ceratodon purpureus TaxID=3225 RepID=A0A8T0IKN4_CERPU|nr:hypothetical protein KC19_3G101400 [Ceratodon purpureus]